MPVKGKFYLFFNRLIKNRLVVAISCISSKDTKSSIKATVKELGRLFCLNHYQDVSVTRVEDHLLTKQALS